jgi:hypothetical protein
MWKEKGNTTTLLFSLKGLEILHQERRGKVKTIVMEHSKGILFHKSGPANKQHTNHSFTHNYFISSCSFDKEDKMRFPYEDILKINEALYITVKLLCLHVETVCNTN